MAMLVNQNKKRRNVNPAYGGTLVVYQFVMVYSRTCIRNLYQALAFEDAFGPADRPAVFRDRSLGKVRFNRL